MKGDNDGCGRELGSVETPGGVLYRLFADGHWEVTHAGERLMASEASIATFYDGRSDFPAYPGQLKLRDLALRTRGLMTWHDQAPIPDVEV